MFGTSTKSSRRAGVIINYVSISLSLLLFYIGTDKGWSVPLIAGEVVALIVAFATFISVHIRTRLWKLVHSSVEVLDERQVQITHGSLRHSYSVFSITCLAILLYIAITETRGCGSLGALLPGSMIYFAHTLPSSILAWTEKEV